jgi:hypothetical protein
MRIDGLELLPVGLIRMLVRVSGTGECPDRVQAVISRGGRPDLAGDALPSVHAPTLLIVGGADEPVIELNRLGDAPHAGTCDPGNRSGRDAVIRGARHPGRGVLAGLVMVPTTHRQDAAIAADGPLRRMITGSKGRRSLGEPLGEKLSDAVARARPH